MTPSFGYSQKRLLSPSYLCSPPEQPVVVGDPRHPLPWRESLTVSSSSPVPGLGYHGTEPQGPTSPLTGHGVPRPSFQEEPRPIEPWSQLQSSFLSRPGSPLVLRRRQDPKTPDGVRTHPRRRLPPDRSEWDGERSPVGRQVLEWEVRPPQTDVGQGLVALGVGPPSTVGLVVLGLRVSSHRRPPHTLQWSSRPTRDR